MNELFAYKPSSYGGSEPVTVVIMAINEGLAATTPSAGRSGLQTGLHPVPDRTVRTIDAQEI